MRTKYFFYFNLCYSLYFFFYPYTGIVPRFCEEIFAGIEEKKAAKTKAEYEVVFSMLEIYNEAVYDLLDPKDKVDIVFLKIHIEE